MIDQEGSVIAPADGGKTSDEILAEIEAQKTRELAPQPEKAATEPESKPDDAPAPEADKPSQEAETSEPAEDVTAPTGKDKTVDINEWMQKKGFKSVEDMAKSLRHLEQKLSQKGRTLDENIPMPPAQTISTSNYRNVPPPSNLQELAESYETTPEDFKRVLKIVNDAADLKLRMAVTPLASEVQRLSSELRKKNAMEELESDPHFKNRAVMKEMYQLMESDPSVQRAPDPIKYAFEKSLQNLGRRFVEGYETLSPDQETRSEIPSTPPPPGKSGQGSAKGARMKIATGKMTPEKFNSLSSQEMEKYLSQQGVVRHDTF